MCNGSERPLDWMLVVRKRD